MIKKVLTADNVNDIFRYDLETGKLYYKIDSNKNNLAGSEAGRLYDAGYLIVSWGRDFKVHRVIWLLAYGKWPDGVIDHKDGNKQNNLLSNLRDVSQKVNMKGAWTPSGSLKIVGVSSHIKNGNVMFAAAMSRDKIKYRLGTYNNLFDACCSRKSAELEYKYTGEVTPRVYRGHKRP